MKEEKTFRAIGATTYLSPIPAVMLGCADPGRGIAPNLITVAWAGIVNSKPPMLSVSIRPERYSHDIIRDTGEFTVNLIGQDLCRAMDFCGVKSGRDLDKFEACGLTPCAAPELAKAVGVAEAPAFLSCRVKDIIPLGSHDLFLAEILQVSVRDDFFLPDGSINEAAMQLVTYIHGKYYDTSAPRGFFGYSVASPEALKRRGF